MIDRAIRVFEAAARPGDLIDRTLIVGWRDAWPLPKVYEYRKRKDWFYSLEMAAEIDRWFFLADLTDPAAVDRIGHAPGDASIAEALRKS